ncbi:MAG: RNA-guided pseudouridylation complex pseudouridine synthase subunit Cbf5 [Methanobacteriota archaeon]|nr:MAG: RNA-guided pseudouridylation complex pseudouridine synthase subunit Cbf5 [Euryarchaeota archaeon]
MSDLVVLHETPDSKHGTRPEDRSLEQRIRLGVAIVDKPAGPTSHQVSAWVRDMFGVRKAGHSGTLDPRVTGVLPVALADATRAVDALLAGDKEYVGVLQLHQDVDPRRIRSMMQRFVGEIYQVPPVRSAVKREQRTRHVYELEPLEVDGRDVLFRVRCESGTYIRTLAVDLGEALGVGANLVDLRRTRTASFSESDARPLNAFRDALAFAKEEGDETAVRAILRPIEDLLGHLPRIVVKDTAVDSICHGANLAVPGVAKLSQHLQRGAAVGVFTGKGEAVALSKALMTTDEIVIAKSGTAADTGRVLMEPGTYPKLWK